MQIGQHFLAAQNAVKALKALVGQNANLVAQILFQLGNVLAFNLLGPLVLLLAFAAEDAHIDDGALDSWRAGQRCVAHIAGLLTEDGAQQLFFRSQLRLALGRDLADQNVAVLDLGADADHAALIQVAQRMLAHVGNVARDLLGP